MSRRGKVSFLTTLTSFSVLLLAMGYAADGKPGAIVLSSAGFQTGADIPRQYTCDAQDISPPLRWSNVPAATKSLALIVDDPDAPGGTWVHWVIYDLPGESKDLAEDMAKTDTLPNGAKQGVNDFRKVGYSGPCPPPGSAHRYYFKLYALDTATRLKPHATKQQLLDAIQGHVLGEAELIARYKR